MNAIELFHSDGKSSGVFYCPSCRQVHRDKVTAEACCGVLRCDCGQPVERHMIRCRACWLIENDKRRRERFENAEKVTEWDGPVQCEGIGYNEGYFANLAELLDFLHSDEETAEWPEYVWTCHVRPICVLEIGRILENATEANAPEDWETGRLTGMKELEAALDAFNEANKGEVYWTPNMKKALLIPKREEKI